MFSGYSLRSPLKKEKVIDRAIGLASAAAVLTFVGWMIHRVFQGFTQNDAVDPAAHARDEKL